MGFWFPAARRSARPLHYTLLLIVIMTLLGACNRSSVSSQGAAAAQATPTARPSVAYVAIGASDAVGLGASNPNKTAYVPLLISHLPRGASALNLGISGATVHDALTQELPQALADQPTLATVWMVGNDFRGCTPLAQYQVDLDKLLAQLESKTRAQVFIANAPDMSLLPAIRNHAGSTGACLAGLNQTQVRALVVKWNQVIATEAQRHHAVLVDLFQAGLSSHPEYISGDGFHPSDAGYKRLADLFWAQITAHKAVLATST
jgi:acyl-CoA thioesterase I